MNLRDATKDDAPLIASLNVASWRSAYSDILDAAFLEGPVEVERRRTWDERMAGGAGAGDQGALKVLIADEDGPAGFVCLIGGVDPRWGSLVDNLHVMPGRKGRGIGTALLRAAVAWAAGTYPEAGLYLWVFEANEPARRFYDRLGGVVVERATTPHASGTRAPALRYAWADPRALASRLARSEPGGG